MITSKEKKFVILILILLLSAFFILGYSLSPIIGNAIYNIEKNFDYKKTPNSEQDIIRECKNKDFIDSASCVKSSIDRIYKYVVTNDSINMTFDELKEKGGDCKDYSELISRLFNGIGFKSKIEEVDYGGSIWHNYVVISHTTDDNKLVHCYLNTIDSEIDLYCLMEKK